MCPSNVISIAIIGIVLAIVLARFLVRINAVRGTDVTKRLFGGSGQGVIQGRPYKTQCTPAGKNTPPQYRVRIDCTGSGSFEMVPEGITETFFKNIGISAEIQTGDPAFDQKFYIVTDDVEWTSAYFRDPAKREAAQKIFQLGFNKIKYNGKIMEAVWSGYDSAKFQSSALDAEAVPLLGFLGDTISQMPLSGSSANLAMIRFIQFIFFSIPTAIGIGGLVLLFAGLDYKPLDAGQLFTRSLPYSIFIFFIFMGISAYALKGRSTSHRELSVIFFITLIGFPLAGYSGTVFVNGYFDRAVPSIHHVRATNKFTTHGKNSTSYHMSMQSWRGRDHEDYDISQRWYDYIRPGQTQLEIATKRGHLGYEWIWYCRIKKNE